MVKVMAVKWNDNLLPEIRQNIDAILTEVAIAIEAQTKINIVDNGQVDTGFMLNSAGHEPAKDGKAAAFVAAEYAIYQEARRSFLYKAGEQVIGTTVDGIITKNKVK